MRSRDFVKGSGAGGAPGPWLVPTEGSATGVPRGGLRGLLLGHLPLELLGREPDDVLVLVRVDRVGLRVEPLERDAPGEHVGLPPLVLGLPRVELRHHLAREQLEARADVLVRRAPRLVQENDLVDVRRLELAELSPDRLGRADQSDLERLLRLGRVAPLLVQLPHIALARRRHAVAPVVREAEAVSYTHLTLPTSDLV